MFGEALGAIAALQQEGLARLRLAERALQLAGFAGEHEGRITGKLTLHLGERGRVGIDGLLLDRPCSPALRCPAALGHGKTPRSPNVKRGACAPHGRLYTGWRRGRRWAVLVRRRRPPRR